MNLCIKEVWFFISIILTPLEFEMMSMHLQPKSLSLLMVISQNPNEVNKSSASQMRFHTPSFPTLISPADEDLLTWPSLATAVP